MAANGVIVYLSCRKDVYILVHSLRFLYLNYLKNYPYPVVVFHDDIPDQEIAGIRIWLHQQLNYMPDIRFELINFTTPSEISMDPSRYDPPINAHRVGYKHMCRFFAGQVYNHPALMQYDWYMRLDSDSFLLSKINFDMFERMDQSGQEYGYICEYDVDSEATSKGFFDTTMQYFKDNGIVPTCLDSKLVNGKWNLDVFYTNFVIGKMSFFRSERYQNYYKYLDATGNFYYRRWGDHDVHWFAVNSFLNENQIWCIKDVTYQHGSWVKNIQCVDPTSANMVPDPYKKWVDAAIATKL